MSTCDNINLNITRACGASGCTSPLILQKNDIVPYMLRLGFAAGVEQKYPVLDPDLMICWRSLPFLRSMKQEKRRSGVSS